MENTPRSYRAFISYSHSDDKIARWLHSKLERYVIPRSLVGKTTLMGIVPRRLFPVFLDREEIPTSADLGQTIRVAIANSGCLIVICSPKAAMSRWVDEEVNGFKKIHGEGRIIALIVAGEPNAQDKGLRPDQECFPPSLRYRMGRDGNLTIEQSEPVAADIRPGQDSRAVAFLRLLAGVLGIDFDTLRKRENIRRRRRLAAGTLFTTSVTATVSTLAAIAVHNHRIVEQQRVDVLRAKQDVSVAVEKQATAELKQTAAERLKYQQLYMTDIRQMPSLWDQGEVAAMRDRLASYVPAEKKEDVRGLEWYYWDRVTHGAVANHQGDGRVTSMDWSGDGRTIWLTDASGRLRSWDLATGHDTVLRPSTSHTRFVAADLAGKRLALIANDDGNGAHQTQVQIIDTKGQHLIGLKDRVIPVSCLAFSGDGARVATGDEGGYVELWNAVDGRLIINLTDNPKSARMVSISPRSADIHKGPVTDVAFSADGRRLASVSVNGELRIWDTSNGKCVGNRWNIDSGCAISSVAYSADGTHVVTRSLPHMADGPRPALSGDLMMWDEWADGPQAEIKLANEFPTSQSANRQAFFPLDEVRAVFALNDTLLVTGLGNVLQLYDPAKRGVVGELKGHAAPINNARVSPDGNLIASADESGDINIWNLRSRSLNRTEARLPKPTRGLAILQAGRRAVLTDARAISTRGLVFGVPAENKLCSVCEGGQSTPRGDNYLSFAASPGGQFAFSTLSYKGGTETSRIHLSKGQEERVVADFEGPGFSQDLRAMTFRREDELYAVNGSTVYRLELSSGRKQAVAQISAGAQPVIKTPSGEQMSQLNLDPDTVLSMAFSPDGRLLALGRASGQVVVVECSDWHEVAQLNRHQREVTGVCFSPDGRRLVPFPLGQFRAGLFLARGARRRGFLDK
jgi:WD40 repeat protein